MTDTNTIVKPIFIIIQQYNVQDVNNSYSYKLEITTGPELCDLTQLIYSIVNVPDMLRIDCNHWASCENMIGQCLLIP